MTRAIRSKIAAFSILVSRFSYLLLFFSVLANPAWAQRAYDVRNLFGSSDDFIFRVSTKREIGAEGVIHEAELCLTSKCDLFEIRGEGNLTTLTTLLDFVLIYTLYASGYGNLKVSTRGPLRNGQIPPIDFILNETARGPALLEMYGGDCPAGSEAVRANCVIKTIVEKHHMSFYFVTYDVGFRTVVPRSGFMERTTVEKIEAQKRWIESFRQ